MIDIIIPVLNEESILIEKSVYYQWLKTQAHLIFVDGGSQDRTVDRARLFGEVINSMPGRAKQMNLASKQSKAEYLLFLHVDTFLNPQAIARLKKAIESGMKVGCFTLKIDAPEWMFRIFEFLINFRARHFRIIDGDLGFMIRRYEFESIGGFDEVKHMEDILISKKIKKIQGFQIINQEILASSRVWSKYGFSKVLGVYSQRYLNYWKNEILALFKGNSIGKETK